MCENLPKKEFSKEFNRKNCTQIGLQNHFRHYFLLLHIDPFYLKTHKKVAKSVCKTQAGNFISNLNENPINI